MYMATARSNAFCRCLAPAREVIMMIGMCFRFSSERTRIVSSYPSMRGISISTSITAGTWSRNCSTASMPSLATSTSIPRFCKCLLVILRHLAFRPVFEIDDVLAEPQAGNIQDQHDTPVAEDGGAGKPLERGKLRSDGFDHDFARAAQAIDLDGDLACSGARDQYRHFFAVARRRGNAQALAEVHVRVNLLVMGKHRIAADREAVDLFDGKFDDIHHRAEREREKLVAHVGHQRLRDGQRQGQGGDGRRGPAP